MIENFQFVDIEPLQSVPLPQCGQLHQPPRSEGTINLGRLRGLLRAAARTVCQGSPPLCARDDCHRAAFSTSNCYYGLTISLKMHEGTCFCSAIPPTMDTISMRASLRNTLHSSLVTEVICIASSRVGEMTSACGHFEQFAASEGSFQLRRME